VPFSEQQPATAGIKNASRTPNKSSFLPPQTEPRAEVPANRDISRFCGYLLWLTESPALAIN
jgi:hypothetical protein